MTAEEWIAAFSEELGAERPSEEQVAQLLELAAVAAHSSERIAAPIACWIAGRRDIDPAEAKAIAERIGGEEA